MRTNELRKLIKTQLNTLKASFNITEIYYMNAIDSALYPHIVFSLNEVSLFETDNNRKNYVLEVDIWDKGTSESRIFEIADSTEDLFNTANLPQTNILPTFFLNSRRSIYDEDKKIKHELIKFQVQLYTK